MDESLLNKLRNLRNQYDSALTPCDPIDFAYRQKELLHALVEHLITPLQEYEMAERSKLRIKVDEDETRSS